MSPRRSPLVLVFLLASAAFAGCLGDDAEGGAKDGVPEVAAEAVVTDKTGSIKGQFITVDLEPLVREPVALLIPGNVTPLMDSVTDLQGRFTFNGVPPGGYRIHFNATCCTEVLAEVVVTAGQVSEVSQLLERIIVMEPYNVGKEWTGFIACSVHRRNVCVTDSKHQTTVAFDIGVGLRTLVVGVDWDPVGGSSTTDDLWLTARHGNYDYAKALGGPPLHLVIDDSVVRHEPHEFANITNEEGTARLSLSVEGPELAVVYQQPFTVYWAEYYHAAAPPDVDLVPDG